MPAGIYTGSGATVVMDPAPLVYVRVFHTGSGPDRHIRRKADEVAVLARTLAPSRTGLLKSSIRVDQNREQRGQYSFGYAVSANTPYAGYVHEGTGPSIRRKHPGAMAFVGTGASAGTLQFAKVVRHPGTPAQPFLEEALVAMVGG